MNENTNTPRSKALLDKVFDHLESIDVAKLTTSELKDFLEVVQKGQFLESYGKINSYGGFFGNAFNSAGTNSASECKTNDGTVNVTPDAK